MFLIAAASLFFMSCTDKECWKCTLKSSEKIGDYYIQTDKYVDCNEDVDRMIDHWFDRGRVSSVSCQNINSGEIIFREQ